MPKPTNLRAIRERLGMSQEDLARALFRHQTMVSHWELGRHEMPVRVARELIRIARHRRVRITLEQVYG
jgi:DNA-binding transcriptional regulator YiaG